MKNSTFVCLITLLVFLTVNLSGQETTIRKNAQLTHARLLGKTQPLRDFAWIKPISPAKRDSLKKNKPSKEIRNFFEGNKPVRLNLDALPKGSDPVRQSGGSRSAGLVVEPTANAIGTSQFQSQVFPPDPNGDVGTDYYIQAVNASLLQVFDKDGNPIGDPISSNSIWAQIGFQDLGDPVIFYDRDADRWFMSSLGTTSDRVLIAISETPDPLGSWFAYDFQSPFLPDYPKYGIWPEAYVLTTNEFNLTTNDPVEVGVYAIDRVAMLNGDPEPAIIRLALNRIPEIPHFHSAAPMTWDGFTTPEEPHTAWVLRINDDSWGDVNQDILEMWRLDIDWDVPANTTLSLFSLETAPFDSNPCSNVSGGFFGCIPQPGTNGISGFPGLVMNRVSYKNFGTHESSVLNFVVDATAGDNIAGIRWMEVRRLPGEDWTVYQEGTYAPDDGLHRFMGAINMDRSGNIGLAYSVSGFDKYPSLRYTGRLANDPLGEMTVEEYEFAQGGGSSGTSRYGDYASMSVDPVDNTFWFTGEFILPSNGWSTKVVAFKLGRDSFDLAPQKLALPQSGSDLSEKESVAVEIINKGFLPATNFQIGFTFENDTAIVETAAIDTLYPDSVYLHVFSDSVDMAVPGPYDFVFFTTWQKDENSLNDTLRAAVSHLSRLDAGISAINGLGEVICDSVVEFTIEISNFGTDTLFSADIYWKLNGDTIQLISWSDTLLSGQSETISLNVSDLKTGVNGLIFYSGNPNGQADELPDNDTLSRTFQILTNGAPITLTIQTDFFPQETTWELSDTNGILLYSGGPYPLAAVVITEEICLDPEACYIFTIRDAGGDGLASEGLSGDYEFRNEEGVLLASIINKNFGFEEINEFCASYECNLSADFSIRKESFPGEKDGRILAIAKNGEFPYEYSIDGGQTFQKVPVFASLFGGEYIIIIRDGRGCTFVDTVFVPTCTLQFTATSTSETTPGTSDGAIVIEASGGTPPYQYSIDGGKTFSDSSLFDSLPAGNYQVEVVDSSDCSQTLAVTIDFVSSSKEQVFGYAIHVFPNPTNGLFQLEVKGFPEKADLNVQILDTQGRPVHYDRLTRYDGVLTGTVSLAAFPAGVYYLRFVDKEIRDLVKIVVSR